jgi:hypothetical protein
VGYTNGTGSVAPFQIELPHIRPDLTATAVRAVPVSVRVICRGVTEGAYRVPFLQKSIEAIGAETFLTPVGVRRTEERKRPALAACAAGPRLTRC